MARIALALWALMMLTLGVFWVVLQTTYDSVAGVLFGDRILSRTVSYLIVLGVLSGVYLIGPSVNVVPLLGALSDRRGFYAGRRPLHTAAAMGPTRGGEEIQPFPP